MFNNPWQAFQTQGSITPRQPYTPDLTQRAINLSQAEQHQAANLSPMLNAMAKPGIGTRSPMMMQRAMPQVAQALGRGAAAPAGIGFGDAEANARVYRGGQAALSGEQLGLAQLMGQLQDTSNASQQGRFAAIMQLLSQFMV